MSVTRATLYDEVWAEPMLVVARRYGVSSSFLARICTRLRVPHPHRGYWAKRAAGKNPHRPPLPEALPGDEFQWVRPGDPVEDVAPELSAPEPKPPAASEAAPPAARRRKPGSRHIIVARVRQHFEVDRLSSQGFIRPWKKVLVDIVVSPATLGKALRTANAVFVELETRGHQVVLAGLDRKFHRPAIDSSHNRYSSYDHEWAPARPTVVFIGTVAIGLTLFELAETVTCRLVDGRWVRAPKSAVSPVDTLHYG